jgi:hypothetical protein
VAQAALTSMARLPLISVAIRNIPHYRSPSCLSMVSSATVAVIEVVSAA